MMHKTAFVILFLGPSCCSLCAQVHVPLFGEPTRMWTAEFTGTIDAQCMDHWTTTYWVAGDTLIDGTTYSRIRNRTRHWLSPIQAMNCTTAVEMENDPVLVRETGQQVFRFIAPGTELLVYDFTAAVGDSIPFPSNGDWGSWSPDNSWLEVIGIDSVEVNGSFRKRFIVEDVQSSADTPCVIEGIGGSYGPFNPLVGHIGLSHGYFLACVREHGEVIYGEPFCMLITDVPDVNRPDLQSPHPNPSAGFVTLDSRISRLQILSPTGQVAVQASRNIADMSLLAQGIYFIHGWDANGILLGKWPVVVANPR